MRTKEYLDGLPSLSAHQLLQVQESKEMHRRSDVLCIAVFQQGGFAAQEQPINSLAWWEQSHQQFLAQCSCYFVATPACKWGLDWYKTWAIAASSGRIHTLSGQCTHDNHQDFRGMDLLSMLSLPNTHPNWPQPSLTLSNLGYRNHHHTVRTLLYGNTSWPKGLLLAAHVSRMVQATIAQQTGQFHYLRTSSRRSENDGSPVFSVTNSIRDSYMHVLPTKLTPSSQMRISFLLSRI